MKGLIGIKGVTGLALALGLFAAPPTFADAGVTVTVTVTPGDSWISTARIGFFNMKKAPQYAAWIETADGDYVQTLMVTARAAKGNWMSAPDEGRPEALPVWFAARSSGTKTADIDAATSATPKAEENISRSSEALAAGREYRIRFEVNHSFDYNDSWPKGAKPGDAGYSGVNGQPSLVYEGRFTAGRAGTIELLPVGQGSIDGSSGILAAGTEGMTTALSIVKKVDAEVRGE